ncbi:MAG TPA: hypothetical protein PK779_14430 [Niabella sp.]|nr:hypothetical protein [Niabella sp.]
MAIDIKVPTVGESINEVTLLKWVKKSGEYVAEMVLVEREGNYLVDHVMVF